MRRWSTGSGGSSTSKSASSIPRWTARISSVSLRCAAGRRPGPPPPAALPRAGSAGRPPRPARAAAPGRGGASSRTRRRGRCRRPGRRRAGRGREPRPVVDARPDPVDPEGPPAARSQVVHATLVGHLDLQPIQRSRPAGGGQSESSRRRIRLTIALGWRDQLPGRLSPAAYLDRPSSSPWARSWWTTRRSRPPATGTTRSHLHAHLPQDTTALRRQTGSGLGR
jgi:hypothetical protein